ncbi:SufD family Fe-S cluster assembly protein [candidate division WOR-3 bacterium]|nr:SufD family Fe-S cluster assembly protein [candidate division WOR-3 bacterium]
MTQNKNAEELFSKTDSDINDLLDPKIAHLIISHDKVVSKNGVEGLKVETQTIENGLHVLIELEEGIVIEKPVHLCFGMLPEQGIQNIVVEAVMKERASMSVLAHCVFPNAIDVQHLMNGSIKLGKYSVFRYFERHVHSEKGGVRVVPKTVVELGEGAKFSTEFELLRGRVGVIDIDYEAKCSENSVLEMSARINGTEDDKISIRETGLLQGAYSRGVLKTKIALRGRSRADVFNKIIASGAYSRGHVDCKEIVMDQAVANAVPIVEVRHPKARVTHEAAIGSVDNRQLETLMSRGVSEEAAEEMIIQGMLSE